MARPKKPTKIFGQEPPLTDEEIAKIRHLLAWVDILDDFLQHWSTYMTKGIKPPWPRT